MPARAAAALTFDQRSCRANKGRKNIDSLEVGPGGAFPQPGLLDSRNRLRAIATMKTYGGMSSEALMPK